MGFAPPLRLSPSTARAIAPSYPRDPGNHQRLDLWGLLSEGDRPSTAI
ncbi:MAG: hypothetical protein ACP5RH_01050 [Leptodesmis sp.]